MLLKMRYKSSWWLTFVVTGLGNLLLGPIADSDNPETYLFVGAILLGVGVANYLIPLGVIQSDRLVLHRAFGLVKLNHPFKNLNDLKIEYGQLHVFSNNRWKMVGIGKLRTHPADWKALESLLASARNQ